MKTRPVIVIVVEPETRVKRIVVAGVDRAISRIDPRLIRVTLAKSADYVVRFTPSQIDLIRGKAISHMARANQRLIGSGKLGVRVRFLFNPVFNGRTASENQKIKAKASRRFTKTKSTENLPPFKGNPDGQRSRFPLSQVEIPDRESRIEYLAI